MSLGARATKGGAKGKGSQEKSKPDKPQPKEKSKPQATTEQLRMANMIDRKSTDDGADVRKMVQDLMEMTCRTEEEVCSALHDTDNDVVAACNLLLEAEHTGEWQTQTNEKKKKKPPPAANNGDVEPPREPRSRSGPRPPGRGAGGGEARGRGAGRGGRGARGRVRGAGRGGARARRHDWAGAPAHANQMGDSFPATEDWDNEEWSGSLSDTKVFTPSASAQPALPETEPAVPVAAASEDWEAPPAAEHLAFSYHNMEQLNSGSRASPAAPADLPPEQQHFIHHAQPMGMSGSLSAAQSQYLSQLTAAAQRHDYTAKYAAYTPPDRAKPRARVPPPSKIPVSAVEMPGGGEGVLFLDVQFGALEPDALQDKHQSSTGGAESAVTDTEPTTTDTTLSNHQLNDSLSSETSVTQPPPTTEPVATSVANGVGVGVGVGVGMLEKQLADTMKQLGVADHHHYAHHRPAKQPAAAPAAAPAPAAAAGAVSAAGAGAAGAAGAAPVYHHPVSHHPPQVYGANVYAQQQAVNSSSGSLSSGVSSAYPASVTLTQYQPMLNSYQTSASATAANAYSSALYTAAAPYSQYHAHHHHKHHKDAQPQYETTSVASASNSLTSTSTTQTSTAKVATTTASVSNTATGGVGGVGGAGGVGAGAGGSYAGGALYGSAYYEELRGLPQHGHALVGGVPGSYYEVGYSREFPLSGERFARAEAASPQQVAGALPPGYAYFYGAPPTSYQYGVYPYTGVQGKYGQPAQQYDAPDTYNKAAGVYSGSGTKAAGGNTADLTNAMYAKTHVALNKVNSYEKAAFHSGTPPPFGAASHLYIPAPPHHHHHQPTTHQMDVRMTVQNSSQNRRQEAASTGGRASSNKPAHSKPTYSHSYWPPN